jgi:hypothetical protein
LEYPVLGVIALALVCATTLTGPWLALKFGRDVPAKASAGDEAEVLRAAAVFVKAIRPASGGLLATLAKLLHRHP